MTKKILIIISLLFFSISCTGMNGHFEKSDLHKNAQTEKEAEMKNKVVK
jgi:hypothetical protein